MQNVCSRNGLISRESRTASRVAARCATALVLALGLAGLACADPLPRLHITALTLASDRARPQAERPFHLTMFAHVSERIDSLGVVLPQLSGLEILGDERHVVHTKDGTDYRESLTIVAHVSGPIDVQPVYVDAIDGRDGKPKRFLSNPLHLLVTGGMSAAAIPAANAFGGIFLFAGVCVVGALAVVLALRRRARPAAPVHTVPAMVLPQAVPIRSVRDEARDAFAVLQRERTRSAAMRLRSLLRRMVGAGDGETLSEVMRTRPALDPRQRAALTAAERAVFTDETGFAGALDQLIACVRGLAL